MCMNEWGARCCDLKAGAAVAKQPKSCLKAAKPFFAKYTSNKSDDDWVDYALNEWGARCCDLKAGTYADNGCRCPIKTYKIFQKKIKKTCKGLSTCSSRRRELLESSTSATEDKTMLRASSN